MSNRIKIGLIGVGDIGSLHAQAAAAVADVDLCMAAGRNRQRAGDLAAETGATLYDSVDALLADPSVDGVDICVPNDLHRELAERALAAGKHVMCEKPIALTLEDADAMIAAAERADRILFVAHILRFWPEYVRTKEWLDADPARSPVLLTARRLVSVLAATTGCEGWRHDPARSGGAVIDLQIHDVDFFNCLLGEPIRVSSQGVRSPDGAISHVWTALEYGSGAQAFVEGSFMFKGNPFVIDFRLLCEEVSVEYSYQPEAFGLHGIESQATSRSEPSLKAYAWGQDEVALYEPAEDSFPAALRGEVAHFAHCIRHGGDELLVRPEEARRSLEVCLCSQRSCEEGRPVEL